MCGITVIVAPGREIESGLIERMTERLAHRGPDAEGFAHLAGCHLGHRRLSVIDLVGGAQPMTEESRRFWIVFNGEIFNFRELRTDLKQRGYSFQTLSDTEVLLRAYQHYGEKVPAQLNGQFAFAIWDQTAQRLFAARDRLGEKPLYWARADKGELLVASEIKALTATGLFQPCIDQVSVDAYLGLLYVPPDRTIFENVHTLAPGHAMTWHEGQSKTWAYWQPSFSHSTTISENDAVARVRDLVAQAVRRQTVADVPVGAFLSGGMDSSTVVGLMAMDARQPVKTFSVGFGDIIDELPYARVVARDYRTEHHEIQMNIDVGHVLETLAQVYDEPLGDSSNIPTYLMAEFARHHVKVVLTGDGGDEIFGGYSWYGWALRDDPTPSNPGAMLLRWLSAFPFRALNRIVRRQEFGTHILHSFVETRNKRCYPDWWDRHLANVSELWSDRTNLWNTRISPPARQAVMESFRPGLDVAGMDRLVDFDARSFLPGDILVKVDRASMAHGLETRAPFLDVDLVEFVWNLPWQLRFKNGGLKHLLRASCRNLWPAEIRDRGKQGFGAPVDEWLKRPDVQHLVRRVAHRSSPLAALLPGAPRVMRRLKPQQIWTLLCLGLWLEQRTECLRNLP